MAKFAPPVYLQELSPSCVIASYTEQRVPQFRGNPLIAALPPPVSNSELHDELVLLPDFNEEQRTWANHERLQMLKSLSNFLFPLRRHIELANTVDSLMRAGYVGRAPRTPEHARIFQSLYEKQRTGVPFRQVTDMRTPQLSTSLIGLSGMGKTTTVQRTLSRYPQVIYHPEHKLYQVPYLHVEMPSDGSSIKGLAHGILHQFDQLIPGANYYEDYAAGGRTGADTIMRSVARLMNIHLVGLLVCDEVQNLSNAHKGGQTVMTELVSACNELKVPILFIGTNKAAKVLSLDFRQSRRASGHGLAPWDRLHNSDTDGANEWWDFVGVLWSHQWTRKPTELTNLFVETLYYYSQGVIDVAIKLFASAQARAILDSTELLTPDLIADVYRKEMQLLHPMLEALRDEDVQRLAAFDDVAPIGMAEIVADVVRTAKAKTTSLYRVKPGDDAFAAQVAASLAAMGFPENEAIETATQVEASGKARNLLEGVEQAIVLLKTPKAIPGKSSAKGRTRKGGKADEGLPSFEDRPHDYRRAIVLARGTAGMRVRNALHELGMTPPVDELLALD